MPTAKKLPSGSWRCQVFSHFEEIFQADGSSPTISTFQSKSKKAQKISFAAEVLILLGFSMF